MLSCCPLLVRDACAVAESGRAISANIAIERALRVNAVLSQLFLQENDAEASEELMARIQRSIERNTEANRLVGSEEGSLLRDEL